MTEALEDFDTQRAGALLATFVDDLSNWYVRRSRRRFWEGSDGALQTLHDTLDVVTRLMAPLVPFVTERVWQDLVVTTDPAAPASVHLASWPEADAAAIDAKLDEAMAVTRRIVELGRSARAEAKVKTRQPLSRALIPSGAFNLLDAELRAEVMAELNVERVESFASAGDLVDYSAKGNFRNLGKRFGKQTPLVASAIASADAAVLSADLATHGRAEVLVADLGAVEVTPEDVIVSERPREGWSVVNEQGETVALDLELTPELVRAGLAREVIRGVQEARKASGFEVSDRILLQWAATDAATADAVRTHAGLIGDEVLATTVAESDAADDWFTDDELGLRFAVTRVEQALMAGPHAAADAGRVPAASAGLTPQMWQSQVEAVALRQAQQARGGGNEGAEERQVMAPWLAGLRPGRPGELSLTSAAAHVVGTLDRYGIEKAILVGHQLGAMVALQVAATEPERVAGLVLSGAMAAPGRVALAMQKGVIRMLPNRTLADSGATKDDLIKALDVIATADFGKRLGDITVPVLIIAGTSDPGLPSAKLLAQRIPNARLAEIPNAGNTPSLEQPDAYNHLLTEFLS